LHLALNFYQVDPARGGAETYVRDLCHWLVREGHRLDLYANQWREGALPQTVRCIRIAAPGWSRWRKIVNFARNSEAALRGTNYDCTVGFINTWYHDVIIPQGGVLQGSLEANARRFPAGWRRAVYRLAKRAHPKFWAYRAIEHKQYDPALGARVVAVSPMVRDHLERYHHISQERIHVIPNAIDVDRLMVPDSSATRRAFRHYLGLTEQDLVALFVGHNFRLKGLDPLLRALAERRRRDPRTRPVHLLVCGRGRPAPYRKMVRRLGLETMVHLIGFLPEVRDAYWASDFFVLPTYYDPCSLVVFEALACGLPVITTASNGAGALITEGREGFVLPAPDALDFLILAIDRLADDASRHVMAEQAAKLGRKQSFDRHVSQLLRVFEGVAASKRAAGTDRQPTPRAA
jgi:UDP-glucose:(heptosyl)LPS alpha-1,3-glucosyltransferase